MWWARNRMRGCDYERIITINNYTNYTNNNTNNYTNYTNYNYDYECDGGSDCERLVGPAHLLLPLFLERGLRCVLVPLLQPCDARPTVRQMLFLKPFREFKLDPSDRDVK